MFSFQLKLVLVSIKMQQCRLCSALYSITHINLLHGSQTGLGHTYLYHIGTQLFQIHVQFSVLLVFLFWETKYMYRCFEMLPSFTFWGYLSCCFCVFGTKIKILYSTNLEDIKSDTTCLQLYHKHIVVLINVLSKIGKLHCNFMIQHCFILERNTFDYFVHENLIRKFGTC